MIVLQHRLIIIIGGSTELHVGSLVSKGRFCEHADKPTHRIASVECALRTSHHVDALDVGVVEVESGFVDERDVIDIQSYGRRIDARTGCPARRPRW